MENTRKHDRYSRLYDQIAGLMHKSPDPSARMATIAAVLQHKMDGFFWTGFYLLRAGELTVHAYQGPVACLVLKPHTGVCWASVDQQKTIVVPDVHLFPGHIACDSRSQSEIVVPLRVPSGVIVGVLDVDSASKGNFDETDAHWLEEIVKLVYA